jgi:dolichol-phosphate mannosyltransferase
MALPVAETAWPYVVPDTRVLVVIPTYNEIENIDEVLRRTRRALPEATVLVVDDNSPDGTGDRVVALQRSIGDLEVLRREGKQGLGAAYRAGFRAGLAQGYDVFIEMDADLSHDPAALPDLVRAIANGADLAIGSRYVRGGSAPDWARSRRAISKIGNTYARAMLGLPVHDATSGFRAYRADVLRDIDLDRVQADGYGFQVEMAYQVHTMGGHITEVPIEFRDRTLGRSKMSMRIVVEALWLVTRWGARDRLHRTRPLVGAPRPVVSGE